MVHDRFLCPQFFGSPFHRGVAAGKAKSLKPLIHLAGFQFRKLAVPSFDQSPVRNNDRVIIPVTQRYAFRVDNAGDSLVAHTAVCRDLAHGKILNLVKLHHPGGELIVDHNILRKRYKEDARVIRSRWLGYHVLYHSPRDARGGKRGTGNTPEGYLVLYH